MNKCIDHTLLKADAMYDKIETLCAGAKEYDSASVCVDSYWVSACAKLLKGIDVKVCTAVGFPLGAMSTKVKAFETAATIADGAKEIDMVLNIREVKAGHYDAVRANVKAIAETAEGNCVKVILENYLLTEEEVVKACKLCVEADATFVKTSTEPLTSRTILEDIKLMKDAVKRRYPMKTIGGVRCYEDMEKMMEAGADRISTSAGVRLTQKETSDGGY